MNLYNLALGVCILQPPELLRGKLWDKPWTRPDKMENS